MDCEELDIDEFSRIIHMIYLRGTHDGISDGRGRRSVTGGGLGFGCACAPLVTSGSDSDSAASVQGQQSPSRCLNCAFESSS